MILGNDWGATQFIFRQEKEKKKEQQQQKSFMKYFLAASSNCFRRMQRKVKCLKMGIFDICPFISLKFYQQLFHVFNLLCQPCNGKKKKPCNKLKIWQSCSCESSCFLRGCSGLETFGVGKKNSIPPLFSATSWIWYSVFFFKSDFSEVCVLSVVMYLSANSSLLAIMYLLALITF